MVLVLKKARKGPLHFSSTRWTTKPSLSKRRTAKEKQGEIKLGETTLGSNQGKRSESTQEKSLLYNIANEKRPKST